MAHSLPVARTLVEHSADVRHTDREGSTALFHTRSADMARFLLERGCDANHENLNGQTPLCVADNEELAALFLGRGADVNHSDREGRTPIFAARTVEHARLLVEHGARIHHKDKHGESPFVLSSSLALTQYYLELGCDVDARDALKRTPLMRAVQANNMERVRLLLAHGARTDVANALGETLLHVVCDPDMADFLYQQGAPLDLQDCTGKTPLQVALNNGNTELARFFLERGAGTDALSFSQIWDNEALAQLARVKARPELLLLWAVKTDDVQQARELLEQGADARVRDRAGNGLLHLASSAEMAQLLLESGADLHAQNNLGETPFALAMEEARLDVLEALLEAGLDVNAFDSLGETPLFAAHDADVAALLIAHGADVHACNSRGRTALMDAFKGEDVLRVLIEAGASPAARDNEGNTALHFVSDGDALQYLVQCGADINALNDRGESPLLSAVLRQDCTTCPGVLLALGANPNLRDQKGWTALMYALARHDTDMVRLLQGCGANFSADDHTLLCQNPDRKASMAWLEGLARKSPGPAFPQALPRSAEAGLPGEEDCHAHPLETLARVTQGNAEANAEELSPRDRISFHGVTSLERARELLALGADVDEENELGETPLFTIRDPEIIRFLLEHGADANHAANDGTTPLFLATSLALAELLVSFGADVRHMNTYGQLPWGHVEDIHLAGFYLQHGLGIESRDADGSGLLHHAAHNNCLAVVRFLVEQGADADMRNILNQSPLHMCSNAGIAAYLIDHGASVNIQNSYYSPWLDEVQPYMLQDIPVSDGASPLVYHMQLHVPPDTACSEDHAQDAQEGKSASRENWHGCADPNTTRILLERGADPNLRDNRGACALHHAHNSLEVELLLAHGADMTIRDNKGNTPLLAALKNRRSEAVRCLAEHGADCLARDARGQTVLHLAHEQELVALFLEHGADANARDNMGRTPIMVCDDESVCRALLEAGADVNARGLFGATALMSAWREDVLFCLLHHGANLEDRDWEGQTALHWHSRREQTGCLAMLLAHGADMQARDVYGYTPLMAAIREAARSWGTLFANRTFSLLLTYGGQLSRADLARIVEDVHPDERLLEELQTAVRKSATKLE